MTLIIKNKNIKIYVIILSLLFGSTAGVFTYLLFLDRTKNIQEKNIDETINLLEQNLKSFDIVSLQNISQVLFGSDYITGLKIVTGNGFVVFDQKKDKQGKEQTYIFAVHRGDGEERRVGTVSIAVNHDPNAVRNITVSVLTGGLLGFLLVRLLLSARGLRNELAVRVASESALRRQEENLRVLLNSLTEAVIATDGAGHVSQMNPVAERLTGWPLAEAKGQAVETVFAIVDGRTRMPVPVQPETGEPLLQTAEHTENIVLVGRNGNEARISRSTAPMIATESRVAGSVIVFRDITAELRAQRRLREMEKMQAIGVLAGGIAHDFNNLLGVISAAAEIITLKDTTHLTPTSAKLLETIVRTTRRGADLTSRLLAVGDETNVEQKLFSLHGSIENVVTLLNRTIDKRFDVEVTLGATNDCVLGNATLVENALLNIGLNASQAMKADKGTFSITTRNVDLRPDDDAVRMHHAPVGPCIQVTLRDNGAGIPAENLSRIFEPFFTNRRGGGGFGLGLWAVYNTVRDHKGTIHVESRIGVETRFVIYLPTSPDMIEPARPEEPGAMPKQKKILIVDDEMDIRTTLSAMLSELGCIPVVATGGEDAIRICKDGAGTLDAVIMDLNMPGMPGEDAIVEILRLAPGLPIIVSSGYPNSSKFMSNKDAGKFLFLKKPYLLADLTLTLNTIFSKPRTDP